MSEEGDGTVFPSSRTTLLRRALSQYEKGEYEVARRMLERLAQEAPSIATGLTQYLTFCRCVADVRPSTADLTYLAVLRLRRGWYALLPPLLYLLSPLFALGGEEGPGYLSGKPSDYINAAFGALAAWGVWKIQSAFPDIFTHKRRCKYCGHYTGYVPPNEGWGWMGTNRCEVCERTYPMPSAQWDREEGIRYMYERGSVRERVFYQEFEASRPEYPRSEAADQVLREQPRPDRPTRGGTDS